MTNNNNNNNNTADTTTDLPPFDESPIEAEKKDTNDEENPPVPADSFAASVYYDDDEEANNSPETALPIETPVKETLDEETGPLEAAGAVPVALSNGDVPATPQNSKTKDAANPSPDKTVATEDESPRKTPVATTSRKLENKRDRRFLYFIIFAIVIVAGAVVGILFGLNIVGGGGNDESSAEQPDNNATPAPSLVVDLSPTPEPVSMPQPVATSEPVATPSPVAAPTAAPPTATTVSPIRSLLLPISGEIIDDPTTPQGRAYLALVDTWPSDTPIDQKSVPQLTQRYAALTTVFSLSEAESLTTLNSIVTGPNECDWPSITCGSFDGVTGINQVTSIKLNKQPNLLQGTIPSELALMPAIESLNFAENNIRGSIPEEMYQLNQIKDLFLYSNRMTGTLSESISSWPYIEKLYLGYNQFSGPIPQNLQSSGVDPVFAQEIRPLKYLILHHNQFTGTIPSGLRLRSLFYCDLGFNQLRGTLPDDFGLTSVRLRHLYMDHNQLTGTIPESYSTVGNNRLIDFIMNDNKFTGGVPASWGKDNLMLLTIRVQNNDLTERMDKDVCGLDVFQGGELVELSADCDICSCGFLCQDCYN